MQQEAIQEWSGEGDDEANGKRLRKSLRARCHVLIIDKGDETFEFTKRRNKMEVSNYTAAKSHLKSLVASSLNSESRGLQSRT